jgi:hypothetical protein
VSHLTRRNESADKKIYLASNKTEADYILEFANTGEGKDVDVYFASSVLEADISVFFTTNIGVADKSVLFVFSKKEANISVYVDDYHLTRNQLLALFVALKII